LKPIINENFPHSQPLQIVPRRTVEGSDVMDLVANTAIKELIRKHGFCPL
jgi:hypothetical protein